MGLKSRVRPVREGGAQPGAGLFLWRPQAGFSALGEKGLPADKVADAAVADLQEFMGGAAAVDPHLADQLLIPMALAEGTSHLSTHRLTRHTLTNIALLQQWLNVAITVAVDQDQPGTVTVEGIAFTPPK